MIVSSVFASISSEKVFNDTGACIMEHVMNEVLKRNAIPRITLIMSLHKCQTRVLVSMLISRKYFR